MKSSPSALVLSLLAASVFFMCGCAGTQTASTREAANSGVKGQVFVENEGAAAGVFVYAYDSPYNDMRVPTKFISAPSADDGAYKLNLPPGTYYIVARRRVSGNPKGYLVKGDYEGKYRANPVVVEPGSYAAVNISVSKLEGAFLLAPYNPTKGDMGLSGKVLDEKGQPAVGAFVMLYTDKEMVGLPAVLSKPADKDGGYSIYLAKPGTYYVAARMKYGGLPRKGEPYGTYDKDPEHKVTINEKEMAADVDIKLGPFPFDLLKGTK